MVGLAIIQGTWLTSLKVNFSSNDKRIIPNYIQMIWLQKICFNVFYSSAIKSFYNIYYESIFVFKTQNCVAVIAVNCIFFYFDIGWTTSSANFYVINLTVFHWIRWFYSLTIHDNDMFLIYLMTVLYNCKVRAPCLYQLFHMMIHHRIVCRLLDILQRKIHLRKVSCLVNQKQYW